MKATLNIPDTEVNDIISFLCEAYDYEVKIYDPNNLTQVIDNPETRRQFAERHFVRPLKQGFDKWLARKAIKEIGVNSNITIDSVK